MLRKIETRELMTTNEARKKYENNYIYMEIVKAEGWFDNHLGYVLYTVEKERDKDLVPRELFNGERVVASLPGYAYKPDGYKMYFINYHGED